MSDLLIVKLVPLKKIEMAEALIRAYQFCRPAGLTQSFARRASDFEYVLLNSVTVLIN